ncbi:MAG TPA: SDR family NAD(P)-dependent oxidoreductase [Solirubrobacteraceae bacterium]
MTGGARGIGLATSRALIARGASVAIVDLDAAAAERAAAHVHDARALGLAADVVANAGTTSRVATFRAISSESFERVLKCSPFDRERAPR